MSEEKTNVMRVLDQKKIPYTPHWFDPKGVLDGATAAALMGKDPSTVYKTLVTQGASKKYYVFVVPVEKELDLKAAAKTVAEKSIEMIRQAQLLPLTGYIHGGCSPVGMKKQFPTVFDQSAEELDTITVSAGKIGAQVEVAPAPLAALVRGRFAPVAK